MIGTVWAVHVADGVLGWPVLLGGFVIVGVLALVASWRIQEDEIPKIALLTAAFFVASSIHVRLGPTSVHLLLNGLVGVILGRRAPLAILIGITLQALLLAHGGLTTIGINALAETLPALAAGFAFPWLIARGRGSISRSVLVATSALVWGGLLVLGLMILWTNPWPDLLRYSASAGFVVSIDNLQPAWSLFTSPWLLVGLAAFAASCTYLDWRNPSPPEFSAGAFVGAFAVVFTTLVTGMILIADGAERWSQFATAVFLAHLPLALLEGLIVGVLVSYLARVKPELLRLPVVSLKPVPLVFVAALFLPSSALAHSLEAECKIDRVNKQITVESWYETGDAPQQATVKVLRTDGSVLVEGPLDDKGRFQFSYETAESLRIEVSAPGGHRAVVRLKESDLLVESPPKSEPSDERSRGRDLLLGLTFLLALSAFLLSWRNAQRLRSFQP